MFKNKKRVNLVAMILTVALVMGGTMIATLAAEHSSKGQTSFKCRIGVGGDEGKVYKSTKNTARLTFTICPNVSATKKKCNVYLVYVDAEGNEYIKQTKSFTRNGKGDANQVKSGDITFNTTVGKNYKYIFSIYDVSYDKETGYIAKWPRKGNDNSVIYSFELNNLTLSY